MCVCLILCSKFFNMDVCVVLREELIEREDRNFPRQQIFLDGNNPLYGSRKEDIIQKYRLNRGAIYFLIDSLKTIWTHQPTGLVPFWCTYKDLPL